MVSRVLVPIFLCLIVPIVLEGAPQDGGEESATSELEAEMIAEFKRFYRGNASVPERIEAIHVLSKMDSVAGVEALVSCFSDKDIAVRQSAVEVLGTYRSSECSQYLVDEIVSNRRVRKNNARMVAIEALSHMGHALAVEPIAEHLTGKDAELRIVCLHALGRMAATDYANQVSELLNDREPAVRIAALDTLGELKEPSVNAAVLARLESKQWQERAAAVAALARLRQKESVQPLIDRLRQEKGRLLDDVLKALLSLTTFDLGNKPDRWQEVWDRIKVNFKVPTEAEIRKAREAFEKARLRYDPGTDDFAGIPTKSTRIIYVIDISGSMEEPLLDREHFRLQGRTYRDFVKMEVVKQELARTIENLDDTVFFNIISFASEVKPWKKHGLVQANILNRKSAAKWVRKLKPIGGASQTLKKKAGLALAAGGGKGKTNTYDALMTALDAKAAQAGYDTNLGSPVDTIFFLSDGDPTAGPVTEIGRILADVRRINVLRKIAINTISIGRNDRGKSLMKALAVENHGTFLDLGE